jgi:cytochrome c-type biogenesis protein CcmF
MAPEIGFGFLLLALIISFCQPVLSFYYTQKNINTLKLAQFSTIAVAASCALSMLCLIYSYVISDFSVLNVFLNSHHLKPLIYKISGSWGNHEGSIILLTTFLSFYTLAFAYLSNSSKKTRIISCKSLIIFCILSFIIFTSNPFIRLFPIPNSGLGLNPVLQDIGLAIHPPMLYTGYIGFSLIFSLAVSALLNKKIDKEFARDLKPWLMFSWAFLTLGIGLGSWWAYRELGWGGFWFWDPVENVSLMPWLCATALLHCVTILKKTGNFRLWTCFLSILSFVFCLLGIFLVRSGILTSIHSFANDSKRGIFIILLLLMIGGSGFLIFSIQSLKIKIIKKDFALFSKSGLVLLNNFLLCMALFIVVLGTLYPLILQLVSEDSISIGPNYYQKLLAPVTAIILFLMILAPYLKLSHLIKLNKKFYLKIALILAISCLPVLFFINTKTKILSALILFLAFAVIISGMIYLWNRKHKNNLTISAINMIIGHTGIALIIIGIAATSILAQTRELNMKIGDEIEFADYKIKFNDLDYNAGKNYLARIGIFTISRAQTSFLLAPETRYYPISDQNTTEAAIKHKIFSDLYLVIGNKDQNENFAVRIYYKPFISLLWLGCFMLFCSGIISLFNKKNPIFKANNSSIK